MSLTDVCFLTYYMRACSFMSDSFVISWTVALQLLCPWNYPSKNIREDCHFLLQEVFQTQGSNPHLLVSPDLQVDALPLRCYLSIKLFCTGVKFQ